MAMIECPECHRQISDRAPGCPGCGAPVANAATTVEQTAKRWKAHTLFASALVVTGLAITVSGWTAQSAAVGGIGAVASVLGVAWLFVARIGTWWHHA